MGFTAPGVYTIETNFSTYAQQLSTAIFGLVTTASKGLMNELTLITDVNALASTFGPPAYPHYGLYAAEEYLKAGNQCWIVRVGTYYAYATCPVLKDVAGTTNALAVSAQTYGSWSNGITITVVNGYSAGTYKLVVLYNGAVVETFDRLLVGTANASSQNFAETRINGISKYITVSSSPPAVPGTATTLALVSGVPFTGGQDGAPADDGDIVGVVGNPPTILPTGLQCFLKPNVVNVNILAVPGVYDSSVVTSLISLVETRQDCMAIIDPPDMLSVQDMGNWHNGVYPTGSVAGVSPYLSAAITSSYAATYYPYLQVFDAWNNQNIWLPPRGHVAMVIANNDNVAYPWSAAAGINRALLSDVIATRNPYIDTGDVEYLYGNGNAVNPILSTGNGVYIDGQRTLQRVPTALDRINVRRLLLYLRKVIATSTLYLIDEPDDPVTWARFINLVEPVLAGVMSARGVYAYQIICDATTNTPLYQNQNQMRAKILIQPTKTAETIVVEFVLLPTGASFTGV